MRIFVSFHAVNRYRKRVLSWLRVNLTDREIIKKLSQAVEKGKCLRRLPGKNVWEYAHDGIFLVVERKSDTAIVKTCLGDKVYRGWCRAKHRIA